MSKIQFNHRERITITYSCLMLVLGLMAVDFFNPSLPRIQIDLQVNQNMMKNLIVVYMLVLGLAQFIYGDLSDSKGRKSALILGLIITTLGMLIAYYSNDITIFYLARIVTACGTAACTVISRAVLVDLITEPIKLRKAFSYFSMAAQLSPALAPILGTIISSYFGWKIQFLCFAILTVVIIILITLHMPETHHRSLRIKNSNKLGSYLELIKDKNFMALSLATALIFSFTIGYYATAPFAFHALDIGPLENSFFYVLYAIVIFIGSLVNSKISLSPTKTYQICLYAFLALFLISYIFHIADLNLYGVGIFSMILAFICGVAAPLTLSLSMTGVEKARGAASALQGSIKMFFTGVFLLLFDQVDVHNFTAIIGVFLIFSIVLLILNVLNRLVHRRTVINIEK